jgi:hypothetical protein
LGPLTPLGILAALVDALAVWTQWPGFHWVALALGVAGQALAWAAWWRSRKQPLPVVYRCPTCNFQGDELAVDVHMGREHR